MRDYSKKNPDQQAFRETTKRIFFSNRSVVYWDIFDGVPKAGSSGYVPGRTNSKGNHKNTGNTGNTLSPPSTSPYPLGSPLSSA